MRCKQTFTSVLKNLSIEVYEIRNIGDLLMLDLQERRRIDVIQKYQILDTPPEQTYDNLVHLASEICRTPMSFVTIVDKNRQWYKAKKGIEIQESELSFCSYTILEPSLFIIEDTHNDPRFANSPYVIGGPKIRFYAGVALRNKENISFGTLCVLDTSPRKIEKSQMEALKILAEQVMTLLELRRVASELEEKKENLRIALDSGKMGSLQIDLDELRISADESFSKLTGMNVSLKNEKFNIISAHLKGCDVFLNDLKKAALEQIELNSVFLAEPVKSAPLWIQARGKILVSASGKRIFTGVWIDVSAQKQKETTIEKQRQLIAHQFKMASIGEMAGGVSHEINNPLSIVLGRIAQAKMNIEENFSRGEVLNYLTKAENAANRISQTIKSLRDFSGDSFDEAQQIVSVQAIVKNVLELCAAKLDTKGVVVSLPELRPSLEIECRKRQIAQVLFQLLSNAYEALKNVAEKKIWIVVEEQSDRVLIKVSNSGPKIDTDIREKMENPFFSTSDTKQGLGLSICRGLVESHGGKFYLDGKSHFTSFVFELFKKLPKENASLINTQKLVSNQF